MAFRVGQKVVCVDVAGLVEADDVPRIAEGQIYTIESIQIGGPTRRDRLGRRANMRFNLVGIRRVHELGYGSFRFRPAAERKTDISIFKKMLTPNTRNVERVS